jgi:hypothetical protein
LLQVKPLDRKAHFSVEVSIIDDTGASHVLRASNYVSETTITPQITHFPLLLEQGRWNSLLLDLSKICMTAYGTQFKECKSVIVHPNCKLRRVYFAEAGVASLPAEFQLRMVVTTN